MSSDDVVIRLFEEGDQEAVSALYLSARDGYMHLPIAGECYAWFVDDKLKPDGDMSNVQTIFMADQTQGSFWVAIHQGKMVGCVGAIPTTKYSEDHTELIRMYVSPECRGKSVGGRLIAELEAWSKLNGYKHIYLSTLALFPAPNYLYPKMGFKLAEAEDLDISARLSTVPAGTTITVNHYVKALN